MKIGPTEVAAFVVTLELVTALIEFVRSLRK